MKSKTMQRVGAALLPFAAAATLTTVAPASASAGSYCYPTTPQPQLMGGWAVSSWIEFYNCNGKRTTAEIYRWVDGTPVQAARTSNTANSNYYYYATNGSASYGCWTYYTKITVTDVGIWRSPGKTLCR